MGKGGAVLTVGRPLPWQEAKDKLTYVRQHGVDQFIQHYRRHETKQRDTLLYGDEIEYGLFKLSGDGASLSLRGDEVRSLLSNREAEERRAIPESGKVTWHPEYGADSASVSERFRTSSSRRWRRRDATSPRRRLHDHQRVHASSHRLLDGRVDAREALLRLHGRLKKSGVVDAVSASAIIDGPQGE
jgi:hypothetical protein